MPHVELSLSETFVPQSRHPLAQDQAEGIERWGTTVATAPEPCLVIDAEMRISAASVSCCELLGLGTPAEAVGRPLLGGVLRLVDFTAARSELTENEIDKIPPLLALTSGRLARGLLRVEWGAGEGDATVDAIATPLWAGGIVTGSLTFFSEV
ncbi:PAS domain-containing protein [Micromonospora sp. NPDC049679]|uniref:PAS domain-containing protein n=1 Tax=Micromonospora sp. NPDC049679 TaxID=3155920 RepID=UPI0033C0DBC5